MSLLQKYKEWKNSPNRTPITISNILGFIQAYFRKWFQPAIPRHIKEQYEYRMKVANKQCLSSGTCINCGCAVPDKFWEDKGCICYTPMVSKDRWKILKKIVNDKGESQNRNIKHPN